MHIGLREIPLRILTTEKTTWVVSTHVILHKTFKLFWKFPFQQTASKQQQRTLWSTHRACGAQKFPSNSLFCVRIFFLYLAVTKKNWSPYLSCPPETLVECLSGLFKVRLLWTEALNSFDPPLLLNGPLHLLWVQKRRTQAWMRRALRKSFCSRRVSKLFFSSFPMSYARLSSTRALHWLPCLL